MGESSEIRAITQAAAEKLKSKGAMLATAESCTGGWIAKALTDLPGSSAWFAGGVVSYSNQAKADLLGVRPATLEEDGAVSESVVCEMAAGARQKLGAQIGVAVSGIAGPDGGTDSKPVGTVWIAWAAGDDIVARHFCFAGNREAVREQTVVAALRGVANW